MQHTTSLEVSKKLKKAGNNRWDTDYFWCLNEEDDEEGVLRHKKEINWFSSIVTIPAYTLGELIRELRSFVDFWFSPNMTTVEWICAVLDQDSSVDIYYEANTPEDACGLALVELLKIQSQRLDKPAETQ